MGRLEKALRRLLALRRGYRVSLGVVPLEARLQRLEEEVREIKGRINGLIFVVLGAVIAQLLLRLLG